MESVTAHVQTFNPTYLLQRKFSALTRSNSSHPAICWSTAGKHKMQVTCFLGNHPNITELKFPDTLIFQNDKLNFSVMCKHE